MSAQYPFTRDYRLRDQDFSGHPHIPKRDVVSQNSKNDDLPSLPWIFCGSLVFISVFFIWVWLLAALVEPQANDKHSPYVSINPTTHSSSSVIPQPPEGAFYTSTPLSTGASPAVSASLQTSVRTEQGRSELLTRSAGKIK